MRPPTDLALSLPRPSRLPALSSPIAPGGRPASDRPRRRLAGATTTLLLLGLVGLPAAGVAGTGRLLSSWMSRAPQIDGQIGPAEWSEATWVHLNAGVTVGIGNDGRTLYLAILDSADPVQGFSDWFQLKFDDEGGVAPVLDDGAYSGGPTCQASASLGEGNLGFYFDQSVTYQEYTLGGTTCPAMFVTDRTSFHSSGRPEGVTYEAAIPLDGPAPLRAGRGERFGVLIWVIRDNFLVGCLPNCAVSDPADFRNLILASGGCNTGPQEFGAGEPRIGLPLDWTSEITIGSGPAWQQSGVDHEPELCIGNITGGAGAAACVANGFQGSTHTESLLRMPVSLAGQIWATVRLRAVLRVDTNGSGQGDLLQLLLRRQDLSSSSMFLWSGSDNGGTFELPLTLEGSPALELQFRHSTLLAGGLEGGFAEVDDVELFCGPRLFVDGFDSGLTTHWSSTLP